MTRPFRDLESRLLRRRFDDIDGVLRFELLVLAVILGGYIVLTSRSMLEGIAARWGAWGVALGVEAVGIVLGALAGGLVNARHVRRLRAPDGPAWMALPVEARDVARHLAWASKFEALWFALPALSVVLAAFGLLPGWAYLVVAASVAGFLLLGADVGVVLATLRARAAVTTAAGHSLPTALRLLTAVRGAGTRVRLPRARFRAGPAWRAVVIKDALTVGRRGDLRSGLIAGLVLGAISLVGWLLPGQEETRGIDFRNGITFFVTLYAAATFAGWMVALTGTDPFATLRALPLGVRTMWMARVAWAAGLTIVLLAGHAVLARGLSAGSLLVLLAWLAGSMLGLSMLGIHFGLSLYPQTTTARRMLEVTLVVIAITSTVFFLMGWFALLVAIVVTARKLPRWERAEAGTA
jgi:hypothetical protein